MFCTNCGSNNSDGARVCSACGMAFVNPYQASQAAGGYDSPGTRSNIPTYLVQAILVTLFCCQPFGIVAIVYAAQVGSKLAAGDYAGAQAASASAKMWCWIGFGICLIGGLFYFGIMVLTGFNHGARGWR
jgi:Interferon-induced transmembrane protein/zinc-ribbon domain